MFITGEHIPADSIVVGADDGKAYVAGRHVGTILGTAVADLREGFKVDHREGEVWEDDA